MDQEEEKDNHIGYPKSHLGILNDQEEERERERERERESNE